MKCIKCERENSMKQINRVPMDADSIKIYYQCAGCNNIDARMAFKKKPLDRTEEKPDLWWEQLPTKTKRIDKSTTDPWGNDDDFGDTCNFNVSNTDNTIISDRFLDDWTDDVIIYDSWDIPYGREQ